MTMTNGELLALLQELSPAQLTNEVSLVDEVGDFIGLSHAELVDVDGADRQLVFYVQAD